MAWRVDPTFPLLLAANRDERHDRPTEPAHWWPHPEGLFAGRDRRAGGTWCGADRYGRIAAVTNVRDPRAARGSRSRGRLVAGFFAGRIGAGQWAEQVHAEGDAYSPFNLLVGDADGLWFVSNRPACPPHRIEPGVWAVSNGPWDARWPKTERAAAALADRVSVGDVSPSSLLDLLTDTRPAADQALPDTGVGLDTERRLSPLFVMGAAYGTRASTVIRRHRGGTMDFHERGFDRAGRAMHRISQHWTVDSCST